MTDRRRPCDVSIIVPVHDGAAFLPSCLATVNNQTDVDTEVIVVDDDSDDDTYERAVELLAGVPRGRVLRVPDRVGPGAARNLGLLEASGRWTLFVDSDDLLAPNVLADLVEQADRSHSDVLVFDHAVVSADGTTIPNRHASTLREFEGRAVSPVEALDLFKLIPAVWNKLFGTDFLRERELVFPPGIYEDMLVTYRALCEAATVTTSSTRAYYYRRRPTTDSELTRVDRRHFDVLDQWDRVHAATEDAVPALRDAVFDRMTQQVVYVFEQRIRDLPDPDAAEFFDEMVRRFRSYRRDGATGSLSVGTPRSRALATGHLRAYRSVERAARSKQQLRSGDRARFVRGIRSRADAQLYRFYQHREQVDDQLVVFSSSWNRYPNGNPEAIARALRSRHPGLTQRWVVADGDALASARAHGYDAVRAGSREHQRLLASAKWFVSDVNFPDHVDKRPGQVHLQTQHGTPLKTMGFDLQAFPQSAGTMDFRRLRRRVDRWDYVISSNPYSSRIWRRAFPARYRMLEVGYPRNDALVVDPGGQRAAARQALGVGDDPVILYAPTLRDYVSDDPPRIDPVRFLSDVTAATGTRPRLLTRHHYLTSGAADPVDGDIIDVSDYRDLAGLMHASDLLITDYSSIMFDYALLGRPIVLYLDDDAEYQRSRGTYLDVRVAGPSDPAFTQDELVEGVAAVLEGQVRSDRLAEFRERFCPWDDGGASERVVEAVFGG